MDVHLQFLLRYLAFFVKLLYLTRLMFVFQIQIAELQQMTCRLDETGFLQSGTFLNHLSNLLLDRNTIRFEKKFLAKHERVDLVDSNHLFTR